MDKTFTGTASNSIIRALSLSLSPFLSFVFFFSIFFPTGFESDAILSPTPRDFPGGTGSPFSYADVHWFLCNGCNPRLMASYVSFKILYGCQDPPILVRNVSRYISSLYQFFLNWRLSPSLLSVGVQQWQTRDKITATLVRIALNCFDGVSHFYMKMACPTVVIITTTYGIYI